MQCPESVGVTHPTLQRFCRPRVVPSWGRPGDPRAVFDRLSWGWGLRQPTCPRARPHENELTNPDVRITHEPRSEEPAGSEGRGKAGAQGSAPAAPSDGGLTVPQKNEDPNGEREPIWTDAQDDVPAEPKPEEGNK